MTDVQFFDKANARCPKYSAPLSSVKADDIDGIVSRAMRLFRCPKFSVLFIQHSLVFH